ncbi:MAG: type I-E CRISPR-associated protein Cas5/CasD [Lentisphaeria bacterium]
MRYLSLYLRAPLQSWGATAKFGERPSLSFPTRSGILGMLAAASGIDRNDDAWLLKLKCLAMRCLVFFPGRRIMDYHTVGGGYDVNDAWSKRRMSPKAEGGTPTTVLTSREYLQDAAFGIVLAAENTELVNTLAQAIRNPVWGVWLGRKCCIPTEPIFAGEFETSEEAYAALLSRAENSNLSKGKPAICKVITEVPANEAEEVWHDIPISFGTREFAARSIRQEEIS